MGNGAERDPWLSTALVQRIEELAAEVGCGTGEWVLEFRFTHGQLRRSYRHHGPINNDDLAHVAVTEREKTP